MDIGEMDFAELAVLKDKIEEELVTRRKYVVGDVCNKIRTLVSTSHLSMEEVMTKLGYDLPARAVKPEKKVVAIKYRHPDNPDLVWSGRGKRPNWLNAALAQGEELGMFLV